MPPQRSGDDVDNRHARPEAYSTWALAFLTLAILVNVFFDSGPVEYVGIVFALAALVLMIMHVALDRKARKG